MKRRLSDNSDLKKQRLDFIRRRPEYGIIWIALSLVAIYTVLIVVTIQLEHIRTSTLVTVVTCTALLISTVFLVVLGKINDLIHVKDFQSALFAGSAGIGTEFFLVFKDNGKIVYYNGGCKKYLSSNEDEDFSFLMEKLQLENVDWKSDIIKKEEYISIKANDDDHCGLRVVIESISRPAGYYAVRAYKDSEVSQLADNDSSLTDVFNEMPFGVYTASEDGKLQYTNSVFSKMLGYRDHELESDSKLFRELVFGQDSLDQDSFNMAWDGSIAFKNKRGLPVKVSLTQTMLSDNTLRCGFISHVSDSLDKQQVEDPTAYKQSFLEVMQVWDRFFENAPISIILMDKDFMITESNASFRSLVKKNKTQKKGWNLLDVLDDKSRNTLIEKIKSVTTVSEPIDIGLVNGKGTAQLYINVMTDEESTGVFTAIVFFLDTTEQKDLEQRFVHSQKMQAVGQLAGGIAHDFNNLLTAMIGFCDLLLIRHPPGEQSFADIMQIKQNANRAANLVRQLLAFSRQQTLQPKVVDLADTIAELSNLIRRLIGENIKLDIHHGRDIYPVRVDEGQLEQVIINLAVNARDAMNEKAVDGKLLTIRTKNVTIDKNNPLPANLISSPQDEKIAHGEYVVIEVSDTGNGIPEHILHQIFEPFFTTKEVGEGTGLGLSTVYGIIQQTGGHIYVSSTGEGAIFSLFLKHYKGKNSESTNTESNDNKNMARDLTGAGTILIVEDEAPVRAFSSRALKNKGYSVIDADCGEAALAIIREQGENIDIVITDVVMPGIDGPTMVKEIVDKYPNIKVIFISGYGEDAFIKTYGSDREFNFLPKPYTLNQLAVKVKDVMK